MINALFSSKPGGTKAFVLDNVTFGWNSISMMFQRECQRISKGLTHMVPMLRVAVTKLNAWAKLNVTPAKVMQVQL